MALKENIHQDLNSALKERKALEASTLRMLSAAFLNREKEKRYQISKDKPGAPEEDLVRESQLTDEEVIGVISLEAKKRKEAIELYEKGKRQDLAEKEKKELEILQQYLPEQLSEGEVKKLVEEAVKKVGVKETKDMGKVMAALMPQIKGRVDGNLVSKIVKDLLASQNNG